MWRSNTAFKMSCGGKYRSFHVVLKGGEPWGFRLAGGTDGAPLIVVQVLSNWYLTLETSKKMSCWSLFCHLFIPLLILLLCPVTQACFSINLGRYSELSCCLYFYLRMTSNYWMFFWQQTPLDQYILAGIQPRLVHEVRSVSTVYWLLTWWNRQSVSENMYCFIIEMWGVFIHV